MKSAHAGMGGQRKEFDALVGDLTATLTTFKVGEREKKELLGALGPMKRDIVEKPTAASPAMDMKSVHEASAEPLSRGKSPPDQAGEPC